MTNGEELTPEQIEEWLPEAIKLSRKNVMSILNLDWHETHDVLQDCAIKALDNPPTCNEAGNFYRWFYKIAHNKAIDVLRRRRIDYRADFYGYDEPTDEKDACSLMCDSEREPELRRVLIKLAPNRKRTIELRLKGKSYKEISAITGRSTGTIGYWIYESIRDLKRFMQE